MSPYESKDGSRYRVRFRKPENSQTEKRGFYTEREPAMGPAPDCGVDRSLVHPPTPRLNIEENAVQVDSRIHVGTPNPRERRSLPYPPLLDSRIAACSAG